MKVYHVFTYVFFLSVLFCVYLIHVSSLIVHEVFVVQLYTILYVFSVTTGVAVTAFAGIVKVVLCAVTSHHVLLHLLHVYHVSGVAESVTVAQ